MMLYMRLFQETILGAQYFLVPDGISAPVWKESSFGAKFAGLKFGKRRFQSQNLDTSSVKIK